LIKDLGRILENLKIDKKSREIELNVRCPLECTVYSSVRSLNSFDVKIGYGSINYVLLEDEPHVKCPHLIVAYQNTIKEIGNTSKIYLNQTCMFPKIRGLSSLCLLIFSPIVELRVDKRSKCYTGALCGLGVNKFGKPLYTENDVEEPFDVKITDEDIRQVNLIRDILNTLLSNDSNILKSDKNKLQKFQMDNRQSLLKLLTECSLDKKKVVEPFVIQKRYIWGQVRYFYIIFIYNKIRI
jgi:hypothetical protein